MTASMFSALGVTPRWGRAFTPEEDQPGASRVVVLNHDYWQRRFGGNPAVIGQDLRLGAEKWTIIGVMPPGFRFLLERRLGGNVDVFVPMGSDPGLLMSLENDVIGRLKPGVTPEQARAELNLIQQSFVQAHPEISGIQASVRPLAEKLVGHLRRGLLVLFGVVVCVLLIACANVANLLLARGGVRQKEMAIRTALGAGRKRLLRQMLTESLLLAALGGLAGCWLAWWGVKLLVALAPEDLPQLKLARVDDAVLWFTFVATLLAGALAGLIPAWQAMRIEVNESLKDGARGSSFLSRKNARRVSPALVVVELALTLVLLIGAGLLIKSFVRLRAVDLGYNPKNLLTMGMPFNDQRTPALRQELRTRLMALPGVQAVTYSRLLPLHDNGIINKFQLTIAGRPLVHDEQKPLAEVNYISPDFFRALATPVLAGRDFTEHDNENAPRVIIINEAFARRHFAGENPLGQRVFIEGLSVEATIIGVAADVKWAELTAEAPAGFYAPTQQYPKQASWGMAIRTAGDPLQSLPAIRQAVAEVAPGRRIKTSLMEQRVADSLAPRRLQLLLFSIFAAVGLVLAAVGVYGVISYSVSRRTHEIGIRMALGAQARDVSLLVVRQGVAWALLGVAVGLAASYALTRLMASLLFNVTPTDPATFAIVSLLLIGIALLAAYLPARRATKVDPLIALRHE
jgi:putative ABC transport system permease protein